MASGAGLGFAALATGAQILPAASLDKREFSAWSVVAWQALMKQARTAIWPLTEFGPIAEAREEVFA